MIRKIRTTLQEYSLMGLIAHFVKMGLKKTGISLTKTFVFENSEIKPSEARSEQNILIIKSLKEFEQYIFKGKMMYSTAVRFFELGSYCVACIDDNRIIGYNWMHFKEHKIDSTADFILDNDELWTGPIFIFPEYRGKGINLQLMNEFLKFALENNFTKIYTTTSANNYGSITGLIRSGFELRGVLERRVFLKWILWFRLISFIKESHYEKKLVRI